MAKSTLQNCLLVRKEFCLLCQEPLLQAAQRFVESYYKM